MYRGSCLCKAVTYEIRGDLTPVGHCHCSKCRKVSGTAGNAVCYAAPKDLVFTQGEDKLKNFEFDDGWGSTFCGDCGSPLPKCDPNAEICYVPAGTLDDDPGPEIMGHIYVGSAASWLHIGDDAPQFEENVS